MRRCAHRGASCCRGGFVKALNTWPPGVRPKVHFSSPRTEMREIKRRNRKTNKTETAFVAPIWTGHADFANPFEFISFMQMAARLEFDVMLESKSKDLALIRLRNDLLRYAPDVAARFGLRAQEAALWERDQQETMEVDK